ncbi:MAG: hypothetical protein H7Z37_05115 [Pyrinomonadaceae bacterium]|nr:hypothetical protein [Pyrinomonadaceae bacterium]
MLEKVFQNLTARNAKIELMLILGVLFGIGLACGGSSKSETPKKPIPSNYLGMWTAQDGSTLQITNEGTGSYKTVGKSFEGAAIEVDEAANTIKMTLLGFEVKSFKIDSPSNGSAMKLDGQSYSKGGAGSSSTKSSSSTTSSGESVPPEAEMQSLAAETLQEFNDAVSEGDFTELRSAASTEFQQQFTTEKLNTAFQSFIERKASVNKVLDAAGSMKLNFSPAPMIDSQGVLRISGTYATTPQTKVKFGYVQDASSWKLLSINVEVQ